MTVAIAHPPLTLSERLTDQFYRFERRGRGWQLYDAAVDLDPPYTPYWGHYTDDVIPDDGSRHDNPSEVSSMA